MMSSRAEPEASADARNGEKMKGAVMFEVASELALGRLCGIGFLAWIARDVTPSILGHVGAVHGHAS